jgi:competence ComEA-like helix-hairpin-helix protein
MPDRVRVNVANSHELLRLPGVGPEQAERIVKFRTEHGPIGNESELSRVLGWRGLGESMWGRVDFSAGDRGRADAASHAAPDRASRSGRDASQASQIREWRTE